MRTKRTHQMSIYEAFSKHEIGQELKTEVPPKNSLPRVT